MKRHQAAFLSDTPPQDTLVGIELMHMIKTSQLREAAGDEGRTAAALFYSLAESFLPQTGATTPLRPPEQNSRHNQINGCSHPIEISQIASILERTRTGYLAKPRHSDRCQLCSPSRWPRNCYLAGGPQGGRGDAGGGEGRLHSELFSLAISI